MLLCLSAVAFVGEGNSSDGPYSLAVALDSCLLTSRGESKCKLSLTSTHLISRQVNMVAGFLGILFIAIAGPRRLFPLIDQMNYPFWEKYDQE